MRSKKMLSFLAATTIAASAFAGFAVTSSAASLDDAKTITADLTYWFDDANGNGTTKIEGNTVFGEYFFTPYGHNAATNKGKTTIDSVEHFNSLRIKSATQDRFAFKVGAAATITFYTQSHASRGVVVTAEDYTTAKESQTTGTTEFEYSVDSAQTIYVTAFGGDFYLAGVSVDITGEAPDVPTTAPDAPTTAPADPTTAPSTPTEAPVVVEQIPLDTTITFADDAYKTYIDLASEADVNKNNVTVGDTAYTHRLYFAGAISNSHPDRYVTFTPAVSGTLEVIAQGGSGERYLAIKQGDNDEQTNLTIADAAVYTYTVEAGVPVTMYSKGSGIGVYSIKLIKTPVVITPTLEDAAAYDDGTNTAVVGKINLSISGGDYTFDSSKITYEGRKPVATDLNSGNAVTDGTVISANDILVYVVINNTTDTNALEHVQFI